MPATQQRNSACVLLAEDELLLRELGETILRQAGYTVQSVSTPEELHTLLDSSRDSFDIVLTDVVMPRMSGQQVVDLVRARWPQIRVIYMSGYSNEELPGLDHDAGFLQKPFTPAELMRLVQEMISK
jgi:CheY-like chemotaxis protein